MGAESILTVLLLSFPKQHSCSNCFTHTYAVLGVKSNLERI